jgi:hypothetical protein
VISDSLPAKKRALQAPADEEHTPTIKEEMDSLKKKRELMDKNMREKMTKEQPNIPKPAQKNPITKKPF